MHPKVLARKLETTLTDVAVLMESASRVNTRSRTVYYKCAVILMASVLELTLYELIEARCILDPDLLKKPSLSYSPIQELSSDRLATPKKLFIAEQVVKSEPLEAVRANFHSMIKFCITKKIITKSLEKKLTFAKDKRNEVHLQKLPHANRNYTKAMVIRIAKTTTAVVDLYPA